MDENLADFLYKVSVIFIFIAAVSVFLLLYNNASSLVDIVKEGMYEEKSAVEDYYDNEEYYFTGAQIISSIHDGLEFDIYVDGVKIDKLEKDVYSKVLLDAKYCVSYDFDVNGKITGISYTKM